MRLISAAIVVFLCGANAGAQVRADVKWAAGRLNVHAVRAPTSELLKEVARQTGISITGADRVQGTSSIDISGMTLAEGLPILLSDLDYVMIGADHPNRKPAGLRIVVSTSRWTNSVVSAGSRPAGVDSSPEARITALASLAERDAAGAVLVLAQALTDGEPSVKRAALRLLGEMDSVESARWLGDLLLDPDEDVRLRALQALGLRQGTERTLQIRRALGDSDTTIRVHAAGLLREAEMMSPP